jgi:DNA-binding CsgD family transcriptional regulator
MRRVLYFDPEAEKILGAGGLSIRDGRLYAAGSSDNQLSAALALATGRGRSIVGRSGTLLKVPRPDKLPLSVAIAPLDDRDRPSGMLGPLAMVLVTAPERQAGASEEDLQALFGLTTAEARLVAALCSGETLATYSAACGTSLNTVKTHLKHVFEKTGETRQADLIRRVTQDVPARLVGTR